MKVAIVDKDKTQLDILSNEICEHYFPEEDIFVYKFVEHDEFIEFLYEGLQYKFVFLDDTTCNLITIKTVQELLPEAIVIVLTSRTDFIPLNNFEVLTKPYDLKRIYDTLVYSVKHATVKPNQIRVLDRDTIRYIDTDMIYYFESYYGKVYVHTHNHKYVADNCSLYQYENLLFRYGFVSIHKSIIINMKKVKNASLEEYTLRNDVVLYSSARKKYKAFNTYKEYIEDKAKYNML